MTRAAILALVVGGAWGTAACAPSPAADGGVADGGRACSENVPAPSDPCLPQCGNELGVGQPCTAGGGQCSDFLAIAGAALCTVDFYDTTLAFCTKACVADDQCGAGAYCDVDPDNPGAGAGCVPTSCRGDPDDAGAPDGGTPDAGAGGVDAGVANDGGARG